MKRTLACCALLLAGCEGAKNGTATVEGSFGVIECRQSGDRAPADYRFDATFLSTRRLQDNLQIVIFEHEVDFEETDALVILINDLAPLQADETRPLVRPISNTPDGINLALNLFQTCPDRPTLHGISGEIRFDKFDIADDPEDTGVLEVLAGTLTASLTSASRTSTVGWVRATFDFLPPKPPLSPAR